MLGARFSAGAWLDCCQTWGVDGSFFFLGRRVDRFRADSVADNLPVLLRPIFAPNIVNGAPIGETNEVTAFPPGFVFPPGSPFAGIAGPFAIRRHRRHDFLGDVGRPS